MFQISEAAFVDPTAFASIRIRISPGRISFGRPPSVFAPNEIAFFDGEHPTGAGHGVLAAVRGRNG